MRNGSDHDVVVSRSGNRPFHSVLSKATSRRNFTQGGATLLSAGPLSTLFSGSIRAHDVELIDFTPLTRLGASGSWIATSREYQAQVLLPWGTSLDPDGPEFSWPPSAEQQARQIGIGHDGMWFFPIEDEDAERGVLCLNHEFGVNSHVLGKNSPESLSDVRVSQHAHGVSVLDIEKSSSGWRFVGGCNTRRIHVNTPMTFSGPAASSELIVRNDGSVPLGTLNNCGCGHTPWGTYLTCEENFHGYFGATNETTRWLGTPQQRRLGFSENGFGYGWHHFDKRFDLSNEATIGEENRYGWIVEVDPFDATKPPVKRTALGRFKHEACAIAVGRDNRIVAYMGDDEADEFVYKFVGDTDYQEQLSRGESPLDHGSLYVAEFRDDFTGRWIRLSEDNPIIKRWVGGPAEIATFTRQAADRVDATPMDRSEWLAVAPNGEVYCALTNNSGRSFPNPANPQAPNPDGHIIRWRDDDDHVGRTFKWDIFKLASSTHRTEASFSDPDSIWIDPDGRLFIGTDGSQQEDMNNQLLVADTITGEIKRLFSGVPGCEITGITTNADRTTLFVNVQHPGNGDILATDFPRLGNDRQVPRDATIALWRRDGGIVGS